MPARVLIIDDDPITLSQAQTRLQSVGYDVSTRHVSLGSSNAILSDQPDILLLDVHMPGLSGDRLADVLAKHRHLVPNLVIILHSSIQLGELQALARSVGAAGAISKTPNDALFFAQFRRIVDAHVRSRAG